MLINYEKFYQKTFFQPMFYDPNTLYEVAKQKFQQRLAAKLIENEIKNRLDDLLLDVVVEYFKEADSKN